MIFRSKDIKGYSLRSLDGEIGKVKTFYFDDLHWVVRYMVVDTGTWLNERKVLISPHAITSLDYDHETIQVNLSSEQIAGSPSLETDKPVSQQFEEALYRYYGWPAYWGGKFMWEAYPNTERDESIDTKTNEGGKAWDPHLRSTEELRAYTIQAVDDEIGHVADFLLDDESWAIRYMMVQTTEWWPGKKVLVSPQWISRVSWGESKVFLSLTRAAIQDAPAYESSEDLSRECEHRLHQHYERAGYWEQFDTEKQAAQKT